MSYNPVSGIFGFVQSQPSGAKLSFDAWKFSPKNNLSKVTNFNTLGYGYYIPGVTEGKIVCSGPYDAGNMTIAVGQAAILTLGITASLTNTVPVLCESIDLDERVEDAVRVNITFQTVGAFSASIA